MIRILSIEDHWLFIEGLKSSFRGERCGISIDITAETIDAALETDPEVFDIILLDLLIPKTRPESNVFMLKKHFPSKPIIILTSEEKSFWEMEMCKAGVHAFLTKNDDRKEIKEVIKRVCQGENICKQRLIELEKETTVNVHDIWENRVKPEEKEILTLYSQGFMIEDIAQKKFRTQSAISKVLGKLRKLFNAKNNEKMVHLLRKKL